MRRVVVVVVGALAFVAATIAVWLLAAPALGAKGALAVALGESLGLPLLLALSMLRSLRRHDGSTRFGSTLVGLVGGCAVLTLLVLGLVARRPLSVALRDAPERHRLTGATARASRALGGWIAPDDGAPSKKAKRPATRPARRTPAPGDAGAARTGPDASARARAPADAGAGRTPAPPARPADEPERTGRATVCEGPVRAVFGLDLGPQGTGDEVVVACDDGVRALWRLEDGRLLERTRITVHPPPGLELVVAEPRVIDVDEDSKPDLLLGAYFTTERGGTRGGDTWWAPGQSDGQFGVPVRLAGGFCAALDAGDIDGDDHVELVIVHVGNPWNQAHPNGEVRWYEREGRRFLQRGDEDVPPSPVALWLADVNRDGLLDAVVRHDGDVPYVVLPGTPRGLGPVAEGVELPDPPSRDRVRLHLDGDGQLDVVRADGNGLVFEATSRLVLAVDEAAPALDHRVHDVGGPARE